MARSTRPMRSFLALLLLACAAAPGAARAGTFSSVEPTRIQAGSFYSGGTLHVRGSVDERCQVAIRVTGPEEHHLFNRRGKIGGLVWGGIEHVTFERAPSFYALFTSAALPAIAPPVLREALKLGYDALGSGIEVSVTNADRRALVEQFVRLKESEGLYRLAPGAVRLADAEGGRRAFDVQVPLPAVTAPGELRVAVFELAGGAVVGQDLDTVRVERVGMPAFLFALAHRRSGLFGLLAVAVLLATGLAVDVLGTVGARRRPHPAVVVLAGLARGLDDAVLSSRHRPRSIRDIERMHARVRLFRSLVTINHELLELLAELEEQSSWASFHDVRVRMGIRALFDGTGDMVRVLNELTGNRYFDLANVVASLRSDVSQFLAKAPGGDDHETGRGRQDPLLVLQMKEIDSRTAGQAGGKAVNLARVECDLGLRVPASFAVTTEAYRALLDSNGLASSLRTILAPARLDAPEDFKRRCELARDLVREARVPPAIAEAIRRSLRIAGFPPDDGLAVRSSAPGEGGGELSFAGQFETLLNVPTSGLVDAWKEVVASRYSPRAVFYRRAAGLAEIDTPMAVLVQRMVPARASGVLFTRRPGEPRGPALLVTAVRGLGPDASAGIASADELVVSRAAPHRVLERRVARKAALLVVAEGGGLAEQAISPEEQLDPAITDEEASRLAATALAVERYFNAPQDVEWVIDPDGRIFLLQARPLRTERAEAARGDMPAAAEVLVRGGEPVWPGRAVGPVHLARTPEEAERAPLGAVLVVPQILPDCVRLISRVSGIVVEHGSVTGHAASILREFRMPSLFGVAGALDRLTDGQLVSLDVATRSLFAGALWPDLRGRLPVEVHGRRTTGLPRMLAGKLTKLSGGAYVGTWACQSLHDVIRFAHEMAIQSMFDIGDRLLDSPMGGVKRLECAPPLQVHLVDLGGGIRPEAAGSQRPTPADVVSTPFLGIWRGLGDPRFAPHLANRPAPFGSVVATSMATAGTGSPNYACITDRYLNLSSRQAYHHAVVDSFLSEDPSTNHVSIRLKGGGASPLQRRLRAEVAAEILRRRHFTVTVTGDVLSGWVRGVDVETGSDDLATLGHLLRFVSRLDMIIEDESDVKPFVEAFAAAERATTSPGPGQATA